MMLVRYSNAEYSKLLYSFNKKSRKLPSAFENFLYICTQINKLCI